MNWRVHIPKNVKKRIGRFPEYDRRRILDALDACAGDPWSGDITKIGGREDLWRRRVGSYRIFYSVSQDGKIVAVKGIERRTSNTY